MAITTERHDGILIATTEGRIDGVNAHEFQADIENAIEDSDTAVILDMEKLSYISSAGLRVILLTAKKLQRQNARLAVCSLSTSIREVFEISGFAKIIPIHGSLSETIDALTE